MVVNRLRRSADQLTLQNTLCVCGGQPGGSADDDAAGDDDGGAAAADDDDNGDSADYEDHIIIVSANIENSFDI